MLIKVVIIQRCNNVAKIDINRPDKIQDRFNSTMTRTTTTLIMNFPLSMIASLQK